MPKTAVVTPTPKDKAKDLSGLKKKKKNNILISIAKADTISDLIASNFISKLFWHWRRR